MNKLRIFCHLVIILFFAVPVFASDVEMDDHQSAYNNCVKLLENIFSQSTIQTGKDGIKVTCTIMPSEQIVSVAWKIYNSGNNLLTIRSEDVRLYSESGEYESIDTEQAVEILYRWESADNVYQGTRRAFNEAHNMPGENMDEESFYESEFKFGDLDDAVISGITYFNCILKKVAAVTAEIKVNSETFKFTFDGGGP
jgi:hypothetical protein